MADEISPWLAVKEAFRAKEILAAVGGGMAGDGGGMGSCGGKRPGTLRSRAGAILSAIVVGWLL